MNNTFLKLIPLKHNDSHKILTFRDCYSLGFHCFWKLHCCKVLKIILIKAFKNKIIIFVVDTVLNQLDLIELTFLCFRYFRNQLTNKLLHSLSLDSLFTYKLKESQETHLLLALLIFLIQFANLFFAHLIFFYHSE